METNDCAVLVSSVVWLAAVPSPVSRWVSWLPLEVLLMFQVVVPDVTFASFVQSQDILVLSVVVNSDQVAPNTTAEVDCIVESSCVAHGVVA